MLVSFRFLCSNVTLNYSPSFLHRSFYARWSNQRRKEHPHNRKKKILPSLLMIGRVPHCLKSTGNRSLRMPPPSLSYGYPESVKIGDGCYLHIYFYNCAFDSQVYDHTARSRQAHNDVGIQYCIWSSRASELLKESIPRHKDPSNSLLRCTTNPKTSWIPTSFITNLRKPRSHEEETIASETEPADASPLSSKKSRKQNRKRRRKFNYPPNANPMQLTEHWRMNNDNSNHRGNSIFH